MASIFLKVVFVIYVELMPPDKNNILQVGTMGLRWQKNIQH
jgi:hypothetical protein